MDPSACRVIYIDDRFNTERWISREGLSAPPTPQRTNAQANFGELPADLQANVNAFLTVFNQVYVCSSGRSFSSKLSEIHEAIKAECTPIIACFDVGSESNKDHYFKAARHPKFHPSAQTESPLPSPTILRREITFSSESDESYGLQLLSRIASDLQVEEGAKVIIPVAIVQPKRNSSDDGGLTENARVASITRSPYGNETAPATVEDKSDVIDPQMMLQCLDAGALDVVKSPLDKAGIMGLTVHAYRVYKKAKKEQAGFMALAKRGRKQSWVGVDEEKPYAYLREAMVKKLLKGICEPETVIEDYQHRGLNVDPRRREVIADEVGGWGFCGHDFDEDELVYAGYCMLEHALKSSELEHWRMVEADLLHFMQGCRVAYNSFVLYHNFRHAVDVLQSLFYFIVQIGILPPYPVGSTPPPHANKKSPIAKLLSPFEGLTLLIAAIGHDVGHPGVNNMFLVKLNAPLAQLYNDQSVLEAFHCAAYSQILRRHWPAAFHDKAIRKLMISSILATDMGVHSDYMQQLGQLQEKIHESINTDSWSPKDREAYKVLTCGLLIKCADISNVARPWHVAEKWTYLLQQEFAHQGEMESAVGMETTLFGGPPEIGNMLKLANGQIGFMTIFAHPLFANVADIIPAMSFAADEILTNKGVWFTRAEQEKRKEMLMRETHFTDHGSVSPRSRSPAAGNRRSLGPHRDDNYFPVSPLRYAAESSGFSKEEAGKASNGSVAPTNTRGTTPPSTSRRSSLAAVAGIATPTGETASRRSSGASKKSLNALRPKSMEKRRSNNSVPSGQRRLSSDAIISPDQPSSENDDPHSLSVIDTSMVNNEHVHTERSDLGGVVGGTDGVQDDRRDTGVSMRAGSDRVPVLQQDPQPRSHPSPKRSSTPTALSKFSFASSDANEPVRSYDPGSHYPPVHAPAGASAPAADIAPDRERMGTGLVGIGEAHSLSNESTRTAPPTCGADTGSPGTEATSVTSDDAPASSSHLGLISKLEVQLSRDSPKSQPSRGSDDFETKLRDGLWTNSGRPSRESSKNEIRTLVTNGEEETETERGNSTTKTVPRRRSRIRMGFSFFKNPLKRQESEEG